MAIRPLTGFGIGMLAGGLCWMLYNDAITRFFSKYVFDSTSSSYLASDLVWNAIRYIIIILGVICVVFGAKGTEASE